MSEFRTQFVFALDAYRQALRRPQYAEWSHYWRCVEDAAADGDTALAVARQFVESDEPERHHVAVDLAGIVAKNEEMLREMAADVVFSVVSSRSDVEVLVSAAAASGETRSQRCVAFLLGCLQTDIAPLRVTATVALGTCVGSLPELIPVLVALTEDSDEEVRKWATLALAVRTEIDSELIRNTLVNRLEDDSESVQLEAVRGLAKRKDERARTKIDVFLSADEPAPEAVRAAELLGPR